MKRANVTEYVHFIEGDVVQTLPIFLANHPDLKVALLYNDCNLYTPTKAVLENLLPRMQPGGVIYLDSYNNPSQQGETRAADEVLSRYGLVLQKDLPPLSQPAYCILQGWESLPDSVLPSNCGCSIKIRIANGHDLNTLDLQVSL